MGVSGASGRLGALKSVLRHIACIAALMWMPLINGQPFFFPDTTSYVRAADIAVYIGSGHRLATEWTAGYSDKLDGGAPKHAEANVRRGGNDVQSGQIMSGRSPYIGAALYLSYVVSNFWLFVIAQAALSYWLIRLTLRRFGIAREGAITAITLLVAGTTSLPYFNGLLLADALASFGILAFLLLATDDGYSRRERAGLWLVVGLSAIAHLTHIVMLLGMVVTLLALQLLRWAPANRRAIIGGAACVAIGFLSTSLTAFAVERVFHRSPQLVPLMTARFIADGPGAKFIRARCGGQDFEVCRMQVPAESSSAFLWSSDPKARGYTTATPEQRARIASQDTAFAMAALKAYPVEQTRMMAYNSFAQMMTFGFGGLNVGCWANAHCWDSLPAPTRDALRRSLSGRNLWPDHEMTMLLYASVATSLAILVIVLPTLWRSNPDFARTMALWMVLGFVAMAICSVLGGAISEPQYRYQGRLVWIVTLYAIITLVAAFRQHIDAPAHKGLASLLQGN